MKPRLRTMLGNAIVLPAQERDRSCATCRRRRRIGAADFPHGAMMRIYFKATAPLPGIGSLGFCNNTSMQLFVKGNGSPFSLTVAGSDTIEDVKMKVAKVAGISTAEQQLI
jgi:hypothetical protein